MPVESKRIIGVLGIFRFIYLCTDYYHVWIGLRWSPEIHSSRYSCSHHCNLRSLSWIHTRLVSQHIRLYLKKGTLKKGSLLKQKNVFQCAKVLSMLCKNNVTCTSIVSTTLQTWISDIISTPACTVVVSNGVVAD